MDMKHPWALYRQDRNLTQQQVANQLGIERLSVIRFEQGMFNHINTETLTELAHLYGRDPDELLEVYQQYQAAQRQEFAATHSQWRDILRNYEGLLHPLIHYREHYELTRNGLCKELCLDYGPIAEYENNKQRAIPEILRTVSEEMHWDYTGLESAVIEWRASGRSSQSGRIN